MSIIPNEEEDDNGHITFLVSNEEIINIVLGYSAKEIKEEELDEMVRQEIKVAYGGYIAESIWDPSDEEGNSDRAYHDFDFISRISLSHWLSDVRNDNLEQCRTEAKQIIDANWTHIQNLARTLVDKEILTQEEVMSIITIEQTDKPENPT